MRKSVSLGVGVTESAEVLNVEGSKLSGTESWISHEELEHDLENRSSRRRECFAERSEHGRVRAKRAWVREARSDLGARGCSDVVAGGSDGRSSRRLYVRLRGGRGGSLGRELLQVETELLHRAG